MASQYASSGAERDRFTRASPCYYRAQSPIQRGGGSHEVASCALLKGGVLYRGEMMATEKHGMNQPPGNGGYTVVQAHVLTVEDDSDWQIGLSVGVMSSTTELQHE